MLVAPKSNQREVISYWPLRCICGGSLLVLYRLYIFAALIADTSLGSFFPPKGKDALYTWTILILLHVVNTFLSQWRQLLDRNCSLSVSRSNRMIQLMSPPALFAFSNTAALELRLCNAFTDLSGDSKDACFFVVMQYMNNILHFVHTS